MKSSYEIFEYFIDKVKEVGADFTKSQYFDIDSRTHITNVLEKYRSITREAQKDQKFARYYLILRNAGFITLVISSSLLAFVFGGLDSFMQSTFSVPLATTHSVLGFLTAPVMVSALLCTIFSCYLWMTIDKGVSGNVV